MFASLIWFHRRRLTALQRGWGELPRIVWKKRWQMLRYMRLSISRVYYTHAMHARDAITRLCLPILEKVKLKRVEGFITDPSGTRFTCPGGMEGWVDLGNRLHIEIWFSRPQTVTRPISTNPVPERPCGGLKPVHTGDKSCRKRQQKSLFPATFVVVFGDYSFGYNLSPFLATFVASVDRLLVYLGRYNKCSSLPFLPFNPAVHGRELNWQSVDHKFDALTTTPPSKRR